MLEMIVENISILWVAAMILFLIVEAATAGLTCIWFAIGCLAALIAVLVGAQIWLQVVLFFVVSILTLYFTRPLVKKYVNGKRQPTNADMVIGMEGVVKEDINNAAGTGTVAVGSRLWTARSASGEPIPAGKLVKAERIEGVKLIVRTIAD